jgi:colanic acid/amylovoran biosynthesis glycosyltransferase
LPHREVLNSLKWADIFLHAAVSEGFCNAVLEAQAMGIPVVCTDADGLTENVADGVTGYVTPRRDSLAMAEKIISLASDGTLRHKMGAAGRKRVEKYFQLEQQMDAFDSFYEMLLS